MKSLISRSFWNNLHFSIIFSQIFTRESIWLESICFLYLVITLSENLFYGFLLWKLCIPFAFLLLHSSYYFLNSIIIFSIDFSSSPHIVNKIISLCGWSTQLSFFLFSTFIFKLSHIQHSSLHFKLFLNIVIQVPYVPKLSPSKTLYYGLILIPPHQSRYWKFNLLHLTM